MVSDIMKKVVKFTMTNMILWREHSLDGIYLTFGKYKPNYTDLRRISLRDMIKEFSEDNRYDVYVSDEGILNIDVVEEFNEELDLYERVPEDEVITYSLESREATNIVLSLICYVYSGDDCICVGDDGHIYLENNSIPNELIFDVMWGLYDEGKSIPEVSDELNISECNLNKFKDVISEYVD